MGLKPNSKYAPYKIYSSESTNNREQKVERVIAETELENPKIFLVKGKPDFSDSNFKEYGWKRINTPTLERQRFLESTPGYKDYKETIIYEGPQGKAIVHVNKKKDRHEIAIYLNNSKKDPFQIRAIKFMFEREWELPLEDFESPHLVKPSDLENKTKQD